MYGEAALGAGQVDDGRGDHAGSQTGVDEDGQEFFTLKNRSRQTLAPTLHSLWTEIRCNEDSGEEGGLLIEDC